MLNQLFVLLTFHQVYYFATQKAQYLNLKMINKTKKI